MNSIRVALCQLNLTTGDFERNFAKAEAAVRGADAELIVFPESQVSNYPSDDLFLDKSYVADVQQWLVKYAQLAGATGKTLVFGAPFHVTDAKKPHNAVMVAVPAGGQGRIEFIASKTRLPNYDVFDDVRWFTAGDDNVRPFTLEFEDGSIKVGLCICEDIWFPEVAKGLSEAGAEIILSINSSPYSIAKAPFRRAIFRDRVAETGVPLVYCNQVGGNDELVWDGSSAVLDPAGTLHEAPQWTECVEVVELVRTLEGWRVKKGKIPAGHGFAEERYVAACLGTRDYLFKNGFRNAVLGLSGGADSTLVALMAADFLGPDCLDSILMPTVYTSGDSNSLAARLADGLGSRHVTVPIQPMFEAFKASFRDAFGETKANVAEENLQAQLRGDVLSWHSNKYGRMILSTGNKSELALGYATLYGDMRGGYNPLKDLYKTEVFELMEMRLAYAAGTGSEAFGDLFEKALGRRPAALSSDGQAALRAVIDRPPSAELAEGQLDSDSLPEYPVLDKILWAMIDHRDSLTNEEVAAETGHPLKLVAEVRRRLRAMEYKRNQACPGPKIHRKSFSKKDWRYPMASVYRN